MVDRFEVVEVEKEQRDGRARPSGAVDGAGQAILKECYVRQSRQRVCHRGTFRLLDTSVWLDREEEGACQIAVRRVPRNTSWAPMR